MSLKNLFGKGKEEKAASACGTACGTGDKKPAACGTACGAGDKKPTSPSRETPSASASAR